MKKIEKKLNKIWETMTNEEKNDFSIRAFLYSVGRLSPERALCELVLVKLGYELNEKTNEILKLLDE